MTGRVFAILVALGLAPPAAAAELPELAPGKAMALDGGTLMLGEHKIRLRGIDTPEMKDWPRGPQARQALDRLIEKQRVVCTAKNKDRYGRVVAVCYVGTTDIGRMMVQQGWATTHRAFTTAYNAEERAAADAGRGFWGEGDKGFDWRALAILGAGLYAGTLAILAAFIAAKALRDTTSKRIEEEHNSEVRQRKARARGVANLISIELGHRAVELSAMRRGVEAVSSRNEPGEVFSMAESEFGRLPIRDLSEDLSHIAEFAPEVAGDVLWAVHTYRQNDEGLRLYTEADGTVRFRKAELVAQIKVWQDTVAGLRDAASALRHLPALAD